jgi:hypothetical protein
VTRQRCASIGCNCFPFRARRNRMVSHAQKCGRPYAPIEGAAQSELLTKTIGKYWVSNRPLAAARMEFQPIRQAAELEEQKRALGVFAPAPNGVAQAHGCRQTRARK